MSQDRPVACPPSLLVQRQGLWVRWHTELARGQDTAQPLQTLPSGPWVPREAADAWGAGEGAWDG